MNKTLTIPARLNAGSRSAATFRATAAAPKNAAAADAARRAEFKATLKRFVEAFGVQCGTRYAADGLTFEQATVRHAEFVNCVRLYGQIVAENQARGELQAKLAPAIGAGAAKFAAGLHLPK